MRCEATFGNPFVVARCERDKGHRPQVWHISTHPKGGTVRWSFTDEERAEWKRQYGVAKGEAA